MKLINPYRVPASEIKARSQKIQQELRQNNIDGLFIVQRVDLFYFSGTAQNGYMYIPADGRPILFIKQYLPRALEESTLDDIVSIKSIKEIPQRVADFYGRMPRKLGFELDVMPVNEFKFYRSLFDAKKCVDGSPLILKVRKIKSEWEIAQLEATAEMAAKTFDYMQTIIQPGLSEIEFAGLFEAYARGIGHGAAIRVRNYQTEAYPWHVLSGKNGGLVGLLNSPASGEGTSAAFPVGAGPKKLCKGEPIMVDLGSVKNGYHLDETRMFAIDSMPDKAMQSSRVAIEIHDALIEKAGPGITVDELFDHSVRLAQKFGVSDAYLGAGEHKVSFVGHGIGLEIIEPPIIAKNRNDFLEPGMVLALEPKLVYQNEFCAGIESVFRVTDTGARLISRVPVKVFVC
jgi:Xaa-Pro aminopeptidase